MNYFGCAVRRAGRVPRMGSDHCLELDCSPAEDSGSYVGLMTAESRFGINNEAVPKKGEAGYNPANKYDYLFKCVVHNMAAITERASLDLCADETMYPFMGFGPGDGSNLVQRHQKKRCVKGGQIVIAPDVDCCRPRAYLHQH